MMRFWRILLGIYQAIMVILLIIPVVIVIVDVCVSSSNARYHWSNLFLSFLLVLPTIIFCLCNSLKMLIPKSNLFKRWKSLTQISIIFAMLCTVFLGYLLIFETTWGNSQISISKKSSLRVGQMAPDFNSVDQFGQMISLSKLRGKIVLLDFWATWCGPCIEELPNIEKVYAEFRDKDLVVVGINLDKDPQKFRDFIESRGVLYHQIHDDKEEIAKAYAVHAIPAIFLVNSQGIIVGKELRGKRLRNIVYRKLTDNK